MTEHTPEQLLPAITWLNMSGDVTITWDDTNRERVLELVRQKMKEGYSFFVIKPRFLFLLGNKKELLVNESQLDRATGVVVPDEQVEAIMANLRDPSVTATVRNDHARLAKTSATVKSGAYQAQHRARSAEEVVRHQTVAVRPVVGG